MTAPQSPLQVPAIWSAIAVGYAEELNDFSARYAREAIRLAAVKPTDRVLDVGTGPGVLAFEVAPLVTHVTAVDFSPGMIEQVEARMQRDNVSNLDAAVMNAQELAFADGSFDAALSLFTFMFIPDRARAFRELYRVLRPGGRVLVATWAPIDRRPMLKIGFDALAEAVPDLPAPTKGDLQLQEECIREMSAAGFRDVNASLFDAPSRVESPEHYLRTMERSGAPFVMLKKKLGEEGWARTSARFLEAIRRHIPEGGIELGAEAILTLGVR
jgi:SAM-dependent methyltransferase